MSAGAERLAHAVAAHLFAEDIAHVRRELEAFAEPELQDTPFFVPERFTSRPAAEVDHESAEANQSSDHC